MNRREFLIGSAAAITLSACDTERFSADMVSKVDSRLLFDVFSVPGHHVSNAFDMLNQRHAGTASAVVLGPMEELEYVGDGLLLYGSDAPESILAKADGLVFPSGFRTHLKKQIGDMLERLKDDPMWQSLAANSAEFGLAEDMPIGEWPSQPLSAKDMQGLTVTLDWRTGRPYEEVYIGVIPTSDWTEIPAHLSFGGWNACPSPEWHVAALRYWREKWGARLVALSHDVMELRVEERPKTRDEAITLAREQYDYCSDIVDQGVGDIASLAHYLMASEWWYFWWD